MRLLHTTTLILHDFPPKRVPEYAILSHRWQDEEVLYQDIINSTASFKSGWSKVRNCCKKAVEDGFHYVWIDTCCIDKTNSVELSMAINSMFAWYEEAAVCYAYLSDVDTTGHDLKRQLERSKWFTRGWTLQELLAPKFVVFIGQAWTEFGTRSSLGSILEAVTKIKVQHLVDFKLCTIATKMSWAAARKTTLVEDEAYCLLGLFGIHLTPIYGEGKNAFLRLQEELIRTSDDESILAWNAYASSGRLLAASPSAFDQELVPITYDESRPEYFFTNKGLIISPYLFQELNDDGFLLNTYQMPLNCGPPGGLICVAITLKGVGNNTFQRIDCERFSSFDMANLSRHSRWKMHERRRICIQHASSSTWLSFDTRSYLFSFHCAHRGISMIFHDTFRTTGAEDNDRIKRLQSGIETVTKPTSDNEFVKLAFGSFVFAVFEYGTPTDRNHQANHAMIAKLAVAIRRCDHALTVKSEISEDENPSFQSLISLFRTVKADPSLSKTDYAESTSADGSTTLSVRLKPRGWPNSREAKMSGGARAYTVVVSVIHKAQRSERNDAQDSSDSD